MTDGTVQTSGSKGGARRRARRPRRSQGSSRSPSVLGWQSRPFRESSQVILASARRCAPRSTTPYESWAIARMPLLAVCAASEACPSGFAVADFANPIFADIVRGAEGELRANGYSLLLTNSEGDAELDADNIALLNDRQVDGMLLSLTRRTILSDSCVPAPAHFPWCCSTVTVQRESTPCLLASTIGRG